MTRKCIGCDKLVGQVNSFYQIQLVQYEDEVYYKTSKERIKGKYKNSPLVPVRSTGTLSICEECYPHYIKGLDYHLEYLGLRTND